jgi:hypothetical protein
MAAMFKETPWHEYGPFIALAHELQFARPELSIALPLERIGGLMGCDWTQVRRWRKRVVREGWLRLCHWRSGDTGGRCAVSASGDETLKVWGLESGREVKTLEGLYRFLGVA